MREPECVDLFVLCGDKYVVEYDATCAAYPATKRNPWYAEVSARGGKLYPYNETELVFETDRKRLADRVLREVPGARLWRDSDEGEDILFPAK